MCECHHESLFDTKPGHLACRKLPTQASLSRSGIDMSFVLLTPNVREGDNGVSPLVENEASTLHLSSFQILIRVASNLVPLPRLLVTRSLQMFFRLSFDLPCCLKYVVDLLEDVYLARCMLIHLSLGLMCPRTQNCLNRVVKGRTALQRSLLVSRGLKTATVTMHVVFFMTARKLQ
jgi:hypothetical protein